LLERNIWVFCDIVTEIPFGSILGQSGPVTNIVSGSLGNSLVAVTTETPQIQI
jgi:hypothetical protein